jgi:hypothetical protein
MVTIAHVTTTATTTTTITKNKGVLGTQPSEGQYISTMKIVAAAVLSCFGAIGMALLVGQSLMAHKAGRKRQKVDVGGELYSSDLDDMDGKLLPLNGDDAATAHLQQPPRGFGNVQSLMEGNPMAETALDLMQEGDLLSTDISSFVISELIDGAGGDSTQNIEAWTNTASTANQIGGRQQHAAVDLPVFHQKLNASSYSSDSGSHYSSSPGSLPQYNPSLHRPNFHQYPDTSSASGSSPQHNPSSNGGISPELSSFNAEPFAVGSAPHATAMRQQQSVASILSNDLISQYMSQQVLLDNPPPYSLHKWWNRNKQMEIWHVADCNSSSSSSRTQHRGSNDGGVNNTSHFSSNFNCNNNCRHFSSSTFSSSSFSSSTFHNNSNFHSNSNLSSNSNSNSRPCTLAVLHRKISCSHTLQLQRCAHLRRSCKWQVEPSMAVRLHWIRPLPLHWIKNPA